MNNRRDTDKANVTVVNADTDSPQIYKVECSRCGRIGLRDGKMRLLNAEGVHRGEVTYIWNCDNYSACDRRRDRRFQRAANARNIDLGAHGPNI